MLRILEAGPRVRRAVLSALIVLTPLFVLNGLVFEPVNLPKLALLTVGVAFVVLVRGVELLQGARAATLKRLWVPAALVGGAFAIGWLASPYKGWGFIGEYYRYEGLFPYVLFALFGILVADAFGGRLRQLAWSFVIGAGVVGAYALLQRLGVDPIPWRVVGAFGVDPGSSTMGNPNYSATYLAMGVPVAIGLYFDDPRRRIFSALAAVATIAGLIATNAQGGWAAGAAAAVVVAGVLARRYYKRAPLIGVVVAALIACAVAGTVIYTIVKPSSTSQPTAQVRGWYWESAAGVVSHSPVFGRGPNSFALDGIRYRPVSQGIQNGFKFADDPHSVFFNYMTTAGIFGAAAFLGLLMWAMRRGRDVIASPDEGLALRAGFLGAVAAYFVQSLVSIDDVSVRLGLWVVLAGLAIAAESRPEGVDDAEPARTRRPLRGVGAPLIAVALIGALGVSVWWSAAWILADNHVKNGEDAFTARRPAEGVVDFASALDLHPDTTYRLFYGRRLTEALAGTGDPRFFQLGTAAFAYTNKLPDVVGIEAYAQLLHAWAPHDPTAVGKALTLYERAVKLDPVNPSLRAEESDVLVAMGRYLDAERVLLGIVGALPSLPDYWGALAVVEAKLGKTAEAHAAIANALHLDPNDPRAQYAQQLLGKSQKKTPN